MKKHTAHPGPPVTSTGAGSTRHTVAHHVRFDPTDIFAALNAARVQYLVVGGIAAIYHGVPRTTFDVDLAVRLEVDNLTRLDHALRQRGFETRIPASVTDLADPRTRRAWTTRKAMKVFSYIERQAPFRVVDIMVRPLPQFQHLYRRRVEARYAGVTIPLVPVKTLIQMKVQAGRPEDQRDVAFLRRVIELARRNIRR